MEKPKYHYAQNFDTDAGIRASLAGDLLKDAVAAALAARRSHKRAALAKETAAEVHARHATDQTDMEHRGADLVTGGGIRGDGRPAQDNNPDSLLDRDAIAEG